MRDPHAARRPSATLPRGPADRGARDDLAQYSRVPLRPFSGARAPPSAEAYRVCRLGRTERRDFTVVRCRGGEEGSDGGDPNPPAVLRPLVVCGPSGAGKGTIISAFMSSSTSSGAAAVTPGFGSSNFAFAVSHTTRQPRPGEVDGEHYHFTSVPKMRSEIEGGGFLEHAEVHGNLYGTSFRALRDVASRGGRHALLDIDVQGVRSVKSAADERERAFRSRRLSVGYLDTLSPPSTPPVGGESAELLQPKFVFISPPSLRVLRERLEARGTETAESLERRTANVALEMEYGLAAGNFDAVVVNDDLDRAMEEFEKTVRELYEG